MIANHACRQRGFTYITVLLLIALQTAVVAAASTVWHTAQKRENERELLFVGDQFRTAIRSYASSGPGIAGQLPRSLDDLLQDPRLPGVKRHLRKIFVDPMTRRAEWGLVRTPDGGGIIGVYSLSEAAPLKTANFGPAYREFDGAASYSEWKFVYSPVNLAPASRSNPGESGADRINASSGTRRGTIH
jgi:type II secretory pathway pseudopilin PulG